MFAFVKVRELIHFEQLNDFLVRAWQTETGKEREALLHRLSLEVQSKFRVRSSDVFDLSHQDARRLEAAMTLVRDMRESLVALSIFEDLCVVNLSLWLNVKKHGRDTAAAANLTTGELVIFDSEASSGGAVVGHGPLIGSTLICQLAAAIGPLGLQIRSVAECRPFSLIEGPNKPLAG